MKKSISIILSLMMIFSMVLDSSFVFALDSYKDTANQELDNSTEIGTKEEIKTVKSELKSSLIKKGDMLVAYEHLYVSN